MRRPLALAVVLAGLLGACGDTGGEGSDTTEASGGCRTADAGGLTLVAEDLEWDADCLQATAGPIVIVIENDDDGVNHNVHLTDAPGSPATELEAGPVRQELEVTIDAGEYEYVCDLHPNMVGTLRVTPANQP